MIKIVDLHKKFGQLEVLKGVNLEVNVGEVMVIVGPSGSGKSTLLRCINLLEEPTSGQIFFDGVDVTAKKINKNMVRQRLGMVFQGFNLFPNMTALGNVTLAPLKVLKQKRAEAEEAGIRLLTKVGLRDKINSYPGQLSGGQKQRVAIARAVVANPRLILADEPTGNLDSKNGIEVINLLSELNKEGTTIIMVTHSERDAGYAHRIVNLFDGQIVS